MTDTLHANHEHTTARYYPDRALLPGSGRVHAVDGALVLALTDDPGQGIAIHGTRADLLALLDRARAAVASV